MTDEERLQLRKSRFNAGTTGHEPKTTIDAMNSLEELKKKKLERAARFGVETKEIVDLKLKERQQRFGIQTKESLQAKKEERRKRFAEGLNSTNVDDKDAHAKLAAR